MDESVEKRDNTIDHNYCLKKILDEKELKSKTYLFDSYLNAIKQKVFDIINEFVVDSNSRMDQKRDFLDMIEQIRGLHTDITDTTHKLINTNANFYHKPSVKSPNQISVRKMFANGESITSITPILMPFPFQPNTPLIILPKNSIESLTGPKNFNFKISSNGPTTKPMTEKNSNLNIPPKEVSFACRKCGKEFTTGKGRNNHEKKRCQKQSIYCQHLYCKKRFISDVSFKKHMDRHLGIESKSQSKDESYYQSLKKRVKKFKCEWSGCEKTFALDCLRKQHVNAVHLKIKPYECVVPGCKLKFCLKDKLDRHMGSVHDLKLFKCQMTGCGQQFSTRSNLDGHHKRIHLKLKKHKCDECEQSFSNTNKLFIHKTNAHNVSKRFACDWPECHFLTNRTKTLSEHKRRHTGERPFICLWSDLF